MAATLSAVFKGVDELSPVFDQMARSGEAIAYQFSNIESAANNALNTATAATSASVNALDSYKKELSGASVAVENLTNAGRASENTFKQQANAADTAEKEVKDFGDASEEAGKKAENFGKSSAFGVNELADALATAGIAKAMSEIIQAFAGAVSAAIAFESAITGVYKTVNGTDEQLRKISNDIKAMSLIMPPSANSIAGVAEAAGQLGIATNDITRFTKVMLNLGDTTNLSADEAATALAKFSNITGTAAQNYENLGSTIVALGNNFATTEASITTMATRMASSGTLAGLAEPAILAFAAAMSSVGIEADAGAGAMSKIFADIQIAVETGSERLEEFAAVAGMTGEQFADVYGNQASEAIYAFIAGLNDVERNGKSATVILEEMGLTDIRLSNALRSLSSSHENLNSALTLANSAWSENTALANEANLRYGTLESRMSMASNASTKFSMAIGSLLTPAVGGLVDIWTKVMSGLSDFIENQPVISSMILGTVGGVTALVAVFTAWNAILLIKSKIWPVLTKQVISFGAAINISVPWLIAATAAIGAIAGAMAALSAEAKKAEDAERAHRETLNSMSVEARTHYTELEKLNKEYDNLVKNQKEVSPEAEILSQKIAEQTAVLEIHKNELNEIYTLHDSLVAKHKERVEGYAEAKRATLGEAAGTQILVGELYSLLDGTERTTAETTKLTTIVDALNQRLPGLSLTYDNTTNSLNLTEAAVRGLSDALVEQRMTEIEAQNYKKAVDEVALAKLDLLALEKEYNKELEYQGVYWVEATNGANGYWQAMQGSRLLKKQPDISGFSEEELRKYYMNGYTDTVMVSAYTPGEIRDLTNIGDIIDKTNEAKDTLASAEATLAEFGKDAPELPALDNYADAFSQATLQVNSDMLALAEMYKALYEEAYTSLEGQYGLFDKIEMKSGMTSDQILTNWRKQREFFTEYRDGLELLQGMGLEPKFLDALSDGSVESASQVKALVDEYKKLGDVGDQNLTDEINEGFRARDEAMKGTASAMATSTEEFATAVQSMEDRMKQATNEMLQDDTMASNARKNVEAYINEFKKLVPKTEGIVAATNKALSNVGNFNPAGYGSEQRPLGNRGFAAGTVSAPNIALVGERGPEIVAGIGGGTVFTAEQTSKILAQASMIENQNLVNDQYVPVSTEIPANFKPLSEERKAFISNDEKRIILDIKGSGEIDVTGTDGETVWSMVQPRLKDAFMGIIRDEIFEEGDRSYVF